MERNRESFVSSPLDDLATFSCAICASSGQEVLLLYDISTDSEGVRSIGEFCGIKKNMNPNPWLKKIWRMYGWQWR